MSTQLIVALDLPNAKEAADLVNELSSLPITFKVGSELFSMAGPDFVRQLTEKGHAIFLDLKFHDIPNTVAKAVRSAAHLNIKMLTVHIVGGAVMFQKINEELASVAALGLHKPRVLGVSVLTSFDDAGWGELMHAMAGSGVKVDYSVTGLVEKAVHWGAGGVVCSAHELKKIRATYPNLFTVVPGIRPEGSDPGDQGRVMTPSQAKDWGASAIVVGRPIYQADNPRKAAEKILKDLE